MALTRPYGANTPVWYKDSWQQSYIYANRVQSDSDGNVYLYLTDDGTITGTAIFSYRPVVTIMAEDPNANTTDIYGALMVSLSTDFKLLQIQTIKWLKPATLTGSYEAAGSVYVNVIAVGK